MSSRAWTAVVIAGGLAAMAFGLRGGAGGEGAPPQTAAAAPSDVTAFRGVRVFDGERLLERATVVVSNGRIQAVGSDVDVPAGARVVEGAGKTLLPGLIDSHTHAFGDALERALAFGVTTELDMFTDHAHAARLRREQQEAKASARADLFSAGTLVTAPGGHGTEYGVRIPTLARPEDADAFVEARLLEGSDYIKAVFDDGAAYGLRWPTLDRATLEAVVTATRRRERLAVVHVGSAAGGQGAIEAGADGLVHLFADAEPAPGFVALVKKRGAFVIPTLTVIDSLAATRGGADFAEDPRIAGWLRPTEIQSLRTGFPLGPRRPRLDPAIPGRLVRRLADAGVPILAGTDAPNPGTVHGASMHRELELLVKAGLTPAQALAAATSVPARAFRLADRGRIAAGLRADLLLVDGDPTRDIQATRAIAGVWKGGVAATRARPEATTVPKVADGFVSDFEEPQIGARFGSGWVVSSDDRMGGKSEARMARTAGGALGVAGNLRTGSPYPWAGAMFFLGPSPMAPADLSAFRALRFRVRGDGKAYRLMLFASRLGEIPVSAGFTASRDWSVVELPFASFGQGASFDGSDLTGVLFTAGPDEGEFRFEIDDVAFVKKP